jgi:hypothetical protein
MKIYNPSGTEILDVLVDDSSVRYRSIMNDDSLTLNFSTTGPVTVPRNSYVDFEGARYTLFYPENFKKNSTRDFAYTLVLHGNKEWLKFCLYRDRSAKPYRSKFKLTATPREFIQLLVDNLNAKYAGGWSIGDCIEATETYLSFNIESCYDVLNRLAQEFSTEWEITGKTIHFRKVEKFKDDPLPLSYGLGNGFKTGIGRQNDGDRQPIGQLDVEGGERNIDYSTYGSNTLLLPKSATLVYEGKTYRTDADGMYITRDGNTNIGEAGFDGSKFYPKRVGTVSEVVVVDAEKHFYDIKDSSIPASLNYRDCRIAGEKATIVFQSGALAGREFDLEQTDTDLTGYIHAERRFKIVPAELDGQIMPGGVFVPQVGDKYAIFNIRMPEAYISDDATKTGASWDMFREAVKYFAEEENDKFSFTGELDGVWSKSRWLEIGGKIVPGGHILFSDPQFQPEGILIRITAIKDYVNKPHKPEITLSNASLPGSFSTDLGKIEAEEVVREADKKEVIRFTKRQWRDAKETMDMLQNAMLDFGEGINPITINTMQLLVGDPSLQFYFSAAHNVIWNKTTKILTATAGTIMSIATQKTISTSTTGQNAGYIPAYTSPVLTDTKKAYYFYAYVSQWANNFLLSETPYSYHPNSSQWFYLVGILNSEQEDGERSFVRLHGITEVLPGRINTEKIVSTDGKMYIDLVNSIIAGRIKFLSTGDNEVDLNNWAAGINDLANSLGVAISDLDDYIDGAFKDGVVSAAEAKAIEKYINQINVEKAALEATYNKLYVNPYLSGTPKTNLLNAKITCFGDIDNLINKINTVIADGAVSASEKSQVDAAFATYRSSLAMLNTRIEEANKAIQDALKSYSDVAQNAANQAQQDANAARQDVNDLGGIVSNLDDYIDGAFRDGVIEAAEAKAIEKYINQINAEKAVLEATYNKLYVNPYLSGTPKTNLLNAKITFFGDVDNLINKINTVIADGAVSASEKSQVDSAFATYRDSLATLNTRIEEAHLAIQNALKAATDNALAVANEKLARSDKFGWEVDGAFMMGVLMYLREVNTQAVNAGLSGISGGNKELPAFWAGGTYAQAINNLAKIILRHDGSGQLAGDKIKWDAIGNTIFSGITMGKFEIDPWYYLTSDGRYYIDLERSNNVLITGLPNGSNQGWFQTHLPNDQKYSGMILNILWKPLVTGLHWRILRQGSQNIILTDSGYDYKIDLTSDTSRFLQLVAFWESGTLKWLLTQNVKIGQTFEDRVKAGEIILTARCNSGGGVAVQSSKFGFSCTCTSSTPGEYTFVINRLPHNPLSSGNYIPVVSCYGTAKAVSVYSYSGTSIQLSTREGSTLSSSSFFVTLIATGDLDLRDQYGL